MIKKSVFENEIISGMQKELSSQDFKFGMDNLDKAIDNIHSAINILENCGLIKQADSLINILNKIANIQEVKDPRKINDPHTRGLTSEKMVKNLLHHGTTFNMADDNKSEDLLNLDIEDSELEILDDKEMDFEDET